MWQVPKRVQSGPPLTSEQLAKHLPDFAVPRKFAAPILPQGTTLPKLTRSRRAPLRRAGTAHTSKIKSLEAQVRSLEAQLAVSSKRPSTNSGQQSSKAPWYVIAGVIGGLAFVVWYLLFRGNGKSYKNLWDALGFPYGPTGNLWALV
jgi:hypothetical protein